ncbi:hypothetical protein ACC672_36710, partial [Rhizobium ruizarguesonis]
NLPWIAFRKRGHRFHIRPVLNCREPVLILTVFAQQLNVELRRHIFKVPSRSRGIFLASALLSSDVTGRRT